VQVCPAAGTVVTPGTVVCVGVAVIRGGFAEVHPLIRIRPARKRRRVNKPETFRAMVPYFTGNIISIV
jgi:hypothetical protein